MYRCVFRAVNLELTLTYSYPDRASEILKGLFSSILPLSQEVPMAEQGFELALVHHFYLLRHTRNLFMYTCHLLDTLVAEEVDFDP